MVNTTSAFSAMLAGDVTAIAPNEVKSAMAFSERSNTLTAQLFFNKFFTMGLPMCPNPIKPIVFISLSLMTLHIKRAQFFFIYWPSYGNCFGACIKMHVFSAMHGNITKYRLFPTTKSVVGNGYWNWYINPNHAHINF